MSFAFFHALQFVVMCRITPRQRSAPASVWLAGHIPTLTRTQAGIAQTDGEPPNSSLVVIFALQA